MTKLLALLLSFYCLELRAAENICHLNWDEIKKKDSAEIGKGLMAFKAHLQDILKAFSSSACLEKDFFHDIVVKSTLYLAMRGISKEEFKDHVKNAKLLEIFEATKNRMFDEGNVLNRNISGWSSSLEVIYKELLSQFKFSLNHPLDGLVQKKLVLCGGKEASSEGYRDSAKLNNVEKILTIVNNGEYHPDIIGDFKEDYTFTYLKMAQYKVIEDETCPYYAFINRDGDEGDIIKKFSEILMTDGVFYFKIKRRNLNILKNLKAAGNYGDIFIVSIDYFMDIWKKRKEKKETDNDTIFVFGKKSPQPKLNNNLNPLELKGYLEKINAHKLTADSYTPGTYLESEKIYLAFAFK